MKFKGVIEMAEIYKKGGLVRSVFIDGKQVAFESFEIKKDKNTETGMHITVKTKLGDIITDDGRRVIVAYGSGFNPDECECENLGSQCDACDNEE